MSVIFATGGLDEMVIDIGYAVFSSMFFMITAMVLFSLWKRSLAASIFTMVLVLVNGVLIQPWKFIITHPSSDWPYPYDQTYQSNMRVISIVWLLFALVAAGCVVKTIRQRVVKK